MDTGAPDFASMAATPSTSRPATGHHNLLNGLWSQMNHGYSEGNPEMPHQQLQQMPPQQPQAFDLNNMFGIQDLQWDSSLLLPVSQETCSFPADADPSPVCRGSTDSVTSSYQVASFTRGLVLGLCEPLLSSMSALKLN